MYSLWVQICKHTSWSPPEMWRITWKDEPIFPSIYSANPSAGVQLLCSVKLAVVALFYIAAQQSSKAKYPEALEDQEQQHCPEKVPCAWSWSCHPSAAPETVLVCIPSACSRLGVCFLVFGVGKVGKGKYLWMWFFICNLFCVSLFFLSEVCPVPAFSYCIQNKGASWPHSKAHLPWVHGGEEGQHFVHKETIQNSGICFNMLQNTLAFSLVTYKDKVPIKKFSSIDLKLKSNEKQTMQKE